MGADQSNNRVNTDWQVDPVVVYETDMWKLNDGICQDGSRVSVFESKNSKESLELLAKYLRTLRHPCIVRHLSSRKQKGQLYLVTEQVVPLEILLCEKEITLEEKIAGIYNVLQALQFLHNMCGMSHNNVCTSSVFVCNDGCWKLAGFERVKTSSETKPSNSSSLNQIHREDIYAFGQFALHLLSNKDELESIPGALDFVTKMEEKCLGIRESRPTCSELCNDLIFKNDFLDIKSFLQNLVLKSEDEKQVFFRYLTSRLIGLQPQLVAQHLSQLLLCRFVFMDKTAVDHFLPSFLCPKTNESSTSTTDSIKPILSIDLFRKHIIPHLLRIICVRNRHIRTVLLKSFSHYVHLFSEEELSSVILPEILLGICDTNDNVVSATLEALSKLVLLLGSEVVIGGYRQKLFTEATPSKLTNHKDYKQSDVINGTNPTLHNKLVTQGNKTKKSPICEQKHSDQGAKPNSADILHNLERSSPDGGESPDEEDWSDWDNDVKQSQSSPATSVNDINYSEDNSSIAFQELLTVTNDSESKISLPKARKTTGLGEEFDIMALEVKSSITKQNVEDDFFSDMEPNIVPSNVVTVPDKSLPSIKNNSTFEMLDELAEEASGWDDSELHFELPD